MADVSHRINIGHPHQLDTCWFFRWWESVTNVLLLGLITYVVVVNELACRRRRRLHSGGETTTK